MQLFCLVIPVLYNETQHDHQIHVHKNAHKNQIIIMIILIIIIIIINNIIVIRFGHDDCVVLIDLIVTKSEYRSQI